jgi:putative FmdB family regulatory protein
MPLYEYQCPKCKTVTEHLHGYDIKPELECETCKVPLIKKFSLTSSIIIKPPFKAVSNPKWVDKQIEQIHENPELDPYRKHRDKPL